MPIVKWLIPIIGKLDDNRPIPIIIIGAPLDGTDNVHYVSGALQKFANLSNSEEKRTKNQAYEQHKK